MSDSDLLTGSPTEVNSDVAANDAPAGSQDSQKIITVEIGKAKRARRTFSVVSVTKDGKVGTVQGGEYHSAAPMAAAKKAAYKACKAFSPDPNEICTVKVELREITKNSAGKLYTYEATRQPAKEVKEISFAAGAAENGNAPVPTVFKYDMKMRSLARQRNEVVLQ